MTRRREPLFVEQRLVVAFDICSSSNIIEDLTLTGNLSRLRNLLIRTKNFLQRESERLKFELYKFTGDGWILLFPSRTSGPRLMRFLTDLSGRFSQNFRAQILPMLEQKPKIVGLTFGVDRGDLVRLVMARKVEYIGRPLNIACRLQSAIKDKDENPQYKILISRHVFTKYSTTLRKYKPRQDTRDLRNIRDGKGFRCVRLHLPL